ncbi:MAG TPA: monofunctional biosynthetic peptidoglycan transglycosylase [Gemmatimonadota bacterium]|nr:monofunctional biosynthetic peptidoglycan transglycosylase [Gemmatimonadota bacterium]
MAARLLLLALLTPFLYVLSAMAWFPAVWWHSVVPPQASGLMGYRVAEAAAEGRALRPSHEWRPIEEMPPTLFRAVMVAEDTRFYEHEGFDFEQIREAWRSNRSGRRLRGASTITQQTAKNVYLDPSRNFLRKGREAILTGWLELWLTKDRILEMYLNVVELGPGIFGAGAASEAYFERSPGELTREQSALLAATLPAPLVRNPAASSGSLRRRQRMILSRMGRWYEGPSLAEEETAREGEPAGLPERIPSEPIEIDVGTSEMPDTTGRPDSIALDMGAQAGEDRAPEDEPDIVPPDTTSPQQR